MKLTATQRTFIVDQLGVTARTKDPEKTRTSAEVVDDSISDAFENYQRREAEVLKSLTALEKVAGTTELMAAFENEISQIQSRVKGALRDGAEAILKDAYRDLEAIEKRAAKQAETGDKNPTFFALRGAADAVLSKLENHPQRAHVQTLITQGRTALTEADLANDEKRYPASLEKLAAAKLAGDTAKDLADKFNAYRIARAPAEGLLASISASYGDPGGWGGAPAKAKLAQADLDARVTVKKYAEATLAVGTVKNELLLKAQAWTENYIESQIVELKKVTQIAFVAADVRQLEDWKASVAGKMAAGEFGTMPTLITRSLRFRVAASDRAKRRQLYLDARKKATDAIAPLKPNTGMAAQVLAFETLLTGTADPLATATAQRFEEGIALCEKVVKDCEALAETAGAAKTFQDDRATLGQRLLTLKGLPAAAQMTDAIRSLEGLLAEADKRVVPAVGDWVGGQEWLKQLKADLGAAETLAASLAGPMATQLAAKAIATPDDVTQAVQKLRADALKLDVDPYKALLAPEIKGVADACTLALGQAGDGHPDLAKLSLVGAADLLVKGLNIQSQQTGFDAALLLASARQKVLVDQAKTGSYTANLAPVNLIQAPLDQAVQAAKARDYTAASAALARANAAALAAEDTAKGIAAYDVQAKLLDTRCKKMKTEGDVVTGVEKLLSDAALAAGTLGFVLARKLQVEAQATMEAMAVKRLAAANVDDPNIATTAEALLKLDGGDKMLDDFVKTLSGEASFDLIAKLAEKRFGIVLTSDTGHKTLSAKAIWEAMAAVPASHATKNPSLKSAKRETPNAGSGGAFSWFDKSMEINGRPNDGGTEKFDKATREKALGLPQSHDTASDPYAPVDETPGNLFNFTVLHEVGHAVDDRLGFMVGKAGDAAFGGWIQHTDLGVIASAVATAKKYDRGYVLAKLNGGNPDAVAMEDDYEGGEPKWKKAKEAVDAWYELAKKGQIWYDYAKSKAAAIDGVVYQEAYGNRWVSYLLAERAKGVTAYQWRAPGEWFAELYMAWFGKKLKDNHPFASWLKTL